MVAEEERGNRRGIDLGSVWPSSRIRQTACVRFDVSCDGKGWSQVSGNWQGCACPSSSSLRSIWYDLG